VISPTEDAVDDDDDDDDDDNDYDDDDDDIRNNVLKRNIRGCTVLRNIQHN
jgi:hypothetical protein